MGCLEQFCNRKSIDNKKTNRYTKCALGKLWNKLEKKSQFIKQKNPAIYALREKVGNNSALRDEGRLLGDAGRLHRSKPKRTGETGRLKKRRKASFFGGRLAFANCKQATFCTK